MKRKSIIGIIAMAVVVLAACSGQSNNRQASVRSDQNASANALATLQNNQPVPNFNYSQLRQNVIDIQKMLAGTTPTTTFMFNMGVPDPVNSCPSIGFPIAATTELTNPLQTDKTSAGDGGSAVIAQVDPTGVYQGDTTGTYIVCLDANGKGFASYWEGFVYAVAGPAKWDPAAHAVVLTGAPSAEIAVSVPKG
jgi:hypothetical protein